MAGPWAGMLLLLLAHWFPWLAFGDWYRGFITCYRSIPWMVAGPAVCHAEPVDAGESDAVSRWVSIGLGGIMAALGVYAACGLHLGLWAALAAAGSSCGGCSTVSRPSLDKILAKTGNWGYNRCNSKMRNCHDKFIALHVTHGPKTCPLYRRGVQPGGETSGSEWTCGLPFCFPDTYGGHVQLGMRILYGVMNEMDLFPPPGRFEGLVEQGFAPWGDMEGVMAPLLPPSGPWTGPAPARGCGLPLPSAYEMSCSNVVNMLRLAQVPIYSRDRQGLRNLSICRWRLRLQPRTSGRFLWISFPWAGKRSPWRLSLCTQKAKREDWTKDRFLEEVSHIPGVYVPSFYTHTYHPDGTLVPLPPGGAPETVTKRIVEDLDRPASPQNHRPHHGNCP